MIKRAARQRYNDNDDDDNIINDHGGGRILYADNGRLRGSWAGGRKEIPTTVICARHTYMFSTYTTTRHVRVERDWKFDLHLGKHAEGG